MFKGLISLVVDARDKVSSGYNKNNSNKDRAKEDKELRSMKYEEVKQRIREQYTLMRSIIERGEVSKSELDKTLYTSGRLLTLLGSRVQSTDYMNIQRICVGDREEIWYYDSQILDMVKVGVDLMNKCARCRVTCSEMEMLKQVNISLLVILANSLVVDSHLQQLKLDDLVGVQRTLTTEQTLRENAAELSAMRIVISTIANEGKERTTMSRVARLYVIEWVRERFKGNISEQSEDLDKYLTQVVAPRLESRYKVNRKLKNIKKRSYSL